MSDITAAQVRKVSTALDRIDKIHTCDPRRWTAKVGTPGFPPTYMGIGVSRWTCDVCRPLVIEAVTTVCGSAEVEEKEGQ